MNIALHILQINSLELYYKARRLVYIGVFTSTKMLAFWPQFLCLSSWMYMTAKASKSMHLGTWHFKKRTFSIFQTASPQGFPLNLPCLNLYLWQKHVHLWRKRPTKTPSKNANVNEPLHWHFWSMFLSGVFAIDINYIWTIDILFLWLYLGTSRF